ncbi:hypothetical protein BJF79_20560 [Actinomadura sp. CNU-125]|uniref:hypothetical protein n=1 Tax=Actinomadura sp. CNU-125 TaxID=1904961 RepID=UPI00095E6215|nr:hypothetical protein [Actinomadura sp. CNU-125]OLT13443.1 hypothetical protein BJF79_20560 [Actinomadura sp. CNU-125]
MIPHARLVQGRHLVAGSRYRVEFPGDDGGVAEITVGSWDRARRIRLEGTFERDGHAATVSLHADLTGRRVRSVRVTGGYRATKGRLRSLRRATWEGEVRFGDWTGAPEISLRVVHRLGAASGRVEPKGRQRGEWKARVAGGGRGRGVLRPFAAVGLLIARRKLRTGFAEGVDGFAARWNKVVPTLDEHDLHAPLVARHTVAVRAVDREWTDAFVAGLRAAVEGLDFKRGRLVHDGSATKDVRLAAGKHLARGARYHLAKAHRDPVEATVAAWDADRVRVEFRTDDGARTGSFESRGASVRVEYASRGPEGWEALGAVTGEIDADVHGWTSGTPVTRRLGYAFGTEVLSLTCAPDGDGWAVTVTETHAPSDWLRPLYSVAIALTPTEDAFREQVATAADRWDGVVGGAADPAGAAAELVDAVLMRGLLEDFRLLGTPGEDDEEMPLGGVRP